MTTAHQSSFTFLMTAHQSSFTYKPACITQEELYWPNHLRSNQRQAKVALRKIAREARTRMSTLRRLVSASLGSPKPPLWYPSDKHPVQPEWWQRSADDYSFLDKLPYLDTEHYRYSFFTQENRVHSTQCTVTDSTPIFCTHGTNTNDICRACWLEGKGKPEKPQWTFDLAKWWQFAFATTNEERTAVCSELRETLVCL